VAGALDLLLAAVPDEGKAEARRALLDGVRGTSGLG
jgi:hypothetical protein